MRLIVNDIPGGHVSLDTVAEFEKTILSDPLVAPAKPVRGLQQKLINYLFRFRKKFGFPDLTNNKHSGFPDPVTDKKHLFAVMMGWDLYKCLPYFLVSNHHKSIYLFDAWPHDHEIIEHFVNFFHIDFVFASSSQSCEMLRSRLWNTNIHWIPEGINPDEYIQVPYNQKNIDVIALGRRYDLHHEKMVNWCREKEIKYLYEKVKSEIIFPTREEFVEGLAHARISICFPSNITHPERAGVIETMTIRYLQSMISRCLIVGHAPKEMIELFGYNPVVEIDMENPVGQVDDLLKNYPDYYPLIEKNYQAVLKYHQWQNRWNQIQSVFKNVYN